MPRGGKRIIKSNIEYWINQGLTQKEAKQKADEWFGYTSRSNKNYYLKRGITKSVKEAEELAKKYIKSNCKLKKENMMKSFSSKEEYDKWKKDHAKKTIANPKNNFQSKEYWINKGYSEKEAVEKIKLHSIKISKRRKEYWINKGYSEKEAVEKVSEFQDKCSLKAFTKRYGEKEAAKKYEAHIELMKEATSFKDSAIQKANSGKAKHSKEFWIKKRLSTKRS